jgi:hypothetical protein
MTRIGLFISTIALVAGLSCNAGGVRRSGIPLEAQTALDTAIEDIAAGRFDKLYQEASVEWRTQASEAESTATLQRLREKLGNARNRSLINAREERTGTAPVPGHSVTVLYQTTFDRAEGVETFTLIEHDGGWALAKYYVSSSALK